MTQQVEVILVTGKTDQDGLPSLSLHASQFAQKVS